MKQLAFEYGAGVMEAMLPDSTDVFIPGETVKDPESIPEEKLEEAQELKKKVEEVKLVFHMKAGKDGRAFGSISTKEVQEELKKQYDISIDKKKMELDVPMKNFGGYDIKVKLHKDVEACLHVSVQPE